jgi:hypothetical protein
MSRRAEDHIPADVLAAAKRAGLKTPLWYAGRSNGHEHQKLDRSLDEVVSEAYKEAGQREPWVPLPRIPEPK